MRFRQTIPILVGLFCLIYILFPQNGWAITITTNDVADLLQNMTGLKGVDDKIGGNMCRMINTVSYGKVGGALAAFGVLILGFGALLGKVTWQQTVLISAAIAAIFGAVVIGNEFGDSETRPGCAHYNLDGSVNDSEGSPID
ncbi:MAG: TrbC/VirB2 family protein [Rickettsiales bacterium]|nr:TrbC/VirB2 family protein [Rickettsiales bacterium]